MKIIVFGMPGSGKDTQGNMLAARLQVEHFTTGGMLRKAAEKDAELAEFLKTGDLVNDEKMKEVIRDVIANNESFILNGYPRNIEQAKFIESVCDIDFVVYLEIPEDLAVARLLNRGRSDDTEDTIINRNKIFLSKTLPVLELYPPNKVLRVDASGEQNLVYAKILGEIEATHLELLDSLF